MAASTIMAGLEMQERSRSSQPKGGEANYEATARGLTKKRNPDFQMGEKHLHKLS
jgi:hypothetical protein